jgi:hypothetical protein
LESPRAQTRYRLPFEIERVYRQRDFLATRSPADFENVEVAADQTNPDEKNKRVTEDAFDGAGSEIA